MLNDTRSFAVTGQAQRRNRNAGRGRGRYRTATALAGGLAATILLAVPAAAQNTHGGNGGQGNSAPAPLGGASSTTGAGADGAGTVESYEGAAGGGAGATGGKGGDASDGGAGGAGGATPGAAGGNGTGGGVGSRTSGGGGGAHGAVLVTSTTPGTSVFGGNGGNGGTSSDGDGGGGGAGGYGVVVDTSDTLTFDHAITGGNGGAGGGGYFFGGSGGDGGHGLVFTGSATVTLNGNVSGGDGGVAGAFISSCCAYGSNGAGGVGVVGSDLDLTINAAVGGGLSGDGVTRALALSLGGTSRLTLGTSASLTGGIEITSGSLELAQDDDVALANDISGSGALIKTGLGAITLSGTNSYSGGTTISGGTLIMGSTTALGTGLVSLDDGTLDLDSYNFDLARIRGNGTLLASGGGGLSVSGTGIFGNIGGSIASDLAISIGAASTLTMRGNNDLTGGITLAGQLILGESGAAGGSGNTITTTGSTITYLNGVDNTANIQIASSTTQLEVAGTDSATQSGTIGEDQPGRGFEKTGTGTLILSATNSYSGTTTVSAGVLGLATNGAAGTGTIVLGDNTTLFNAAPCGCASTISNDIQIALNGTAAIGSFGNDTVLSGTISGSDLLFSDDFGTGTFTLTGTNSYGVTGVASLVTLRVGDGGTTGTLGTGFVTVDGSLVFDRSDDITVSNNIDGSGSLTQAGSGTLILTGANIYSGGTAITQGTLQIGNGGTIGTIGTGTISNDGALVFNRSDDLSVSDDITGTGSITKLGAGTLTFTGTNNYTGITSILAGTLAIGADGLGASSRVDIDNGAGVKLLADSGQGGDLTILSGGGAIDTDNYTFTVSGGVDFQGELTKLGAGTLELRDENDAGIGAGGINVLAGTLALGSDTAPGTGLIKLANGTTLLNASCGCGPLTLTNAIQIALGGTATIDADGYETVLSGNLTGGNLIFADTFGGGTTILTGTNSYGNTSVQLSATLMIGDGGTTGTLGTGTVTTNGMLAFNRSDEVTLATDIGGSGFLGQFGSGTLILTGNNSYSSGTLIYDPNNPGDMGGTLQVGNGGTTGTLGNGPVFLFGTLIFNRSDDVDVGGSITGLGQITKLGAGTLTLSGDNLNGVSGPWTGTISVQGGTLATTEFGLGAAELVELGAGTTLRALNDAYAGDVAILAGGATIDTDAYTFEMIGALDLQGELTKTGSGTLLLDDLNEEGTGAGGINVTAGTLGLGSDFAAGTGLIKLANGTTLLNAGCGCTTLDIDNDIQIALGGAVTFDGAGERTDLNGAISGGDIHFTTSVSAPFAGGLFRLNGANSYGETRIGANVALLVYDGTLGTGNVVFDATASDPTTPAALVFQNATDYSFGGKIVGGGIVSVESDPGNSVTLTGSNTATDNFTGTVEVISGRLVINGNFGDVMGNTATLTVDDSCLCGGPTPSIGGSGVFHGDISFGNGTLAPGNSPGTLVIAGNLTLGSATILNFELGEPGTPGGANNDLVTVGGNLTLNGTLNTIASGAGYGPGYYRLFNYGGTLTDNEILIGSIAGGLDATVLTNINGQVNLRLGGAQAIQYWDGADMGTTVGVAGGSGTWNAASTNWTGPTGYAINDGWRGQAGAFAGAAGGTVTVVGTQSFEELRFETDGYVLSPFDSTARLNTTGGFSILDVASGITADIGVVIQGGAGIDKTGDGTLILSAVNTYTGATDIAAGTLRMGIDNGLNNQTALNVQAGATFDLAGFTTRVGAIQGAGTITLDNGRLETGYNNSSTIFSGTITGADGGTSDFTKNGGGTLTLSGTINVGHNPTLDAVIQINSGTLEITGTGTLTADLIQNFATIENYGTMSGLKSLSGTAVNHSTGVINGSVQTFTDFTSTGIINGALSNFSTAHIQNQVNGELGNLQNGAITTLTGTTTGITNVNSAQGTTFDLAGFNTIVGALGGGGGEIRLGGATLTVDSSAIAFADYSGAITGNGLLVKTGAGEQILRGAGTNVPLIHVDAGTLVIADTGAITSDVAVANGATFNINGALGGYVTNNGVLNLGGSSSIASVLPLALINNSGGVAHAAGTFNAGVQNAGTFYVDNMLTGVTEFDQAAGGQLALSADFGVGKLTGSGTVDTGFNALTVGIGDMSSSFDGTISGNGGLTKTGAGVFTLTGNQTYTGQTVVSGGTLELTSTGALSGQVNNYANFESAGILRGDLYNDTGATALLQGQLNGIENHGTVTLSGAIVSDRTFEQANTGIFDLAGFNASFGALDGAGKIDLGAGYLSVGTSGISTSFAGSINGSGGIGKNGLGTLTLTGISTYGGSTQITGGTLQLADGGEIGSGIVYNDATLAFDGALDRNFGNVVQGNGSLIKTGTGLLTLSGLNTAFSGAVDVQGGTLGFDDRRALGSGTISLADGTRLRNTGNGVTSVANAIQVAAGGVATLQGVDGSATTFNGNISGGTVRFGLSGGGGTAFTLGMANSYGDTRIGGGVALRLDGAGTLGTGNTVFEATAFPSSLTFNNGSNYSYGGTISGNGSIVVDTLASFISVTLTGSNSASDNFTGSVTVDSGTLVLNGDFGDVVNNSASLTLNGGSLGGSGMFHGDVTFGNASLNPGNSPGTLSIAGNLNLGAGTILNYELGEAGTVGGANNDLVNVGGNLILDGTLNVTAEPGFGEGYYRLFNYGGTLTDNGLLMGALPAGYTPTLLTNIAGQVNLLFASSPQAIQYWDGGDTTGSSTAAGGDGGSGTWSSGRTNWTAPTGYGVNDSWRGQVAVFGGASGGTVTVQGTQAFQELRFTTGGYAIGGATAADGLATTGGFSVVDVSSGVDATINAVISGTGGLTKTGDGTLSLGGANSYTGDTTISDGALTVLAGGSLAGAVVNDAVFNNQGMVTGLVTNNATMTSTGTLNGGLNNSGTASISGVLHGAVTNTISGTITLTGATTGIGAVTQNGSFDLNGFSTSFGSLVGAGTVVLGSATLTLGGDNSSTSFDGQIDGSGGVTKIGTGTLTLSGAGTYTGTTTVSAGTLQLDSGATLEGAVRNDATFNNAGRVAGLVTNTGTLASTGIVNGGLSNSGTASISGTLNGGVTNSGAIGLIGSTIGIGAVTQTTAGSIALNGFTTGFGSLAGAGTVDTGGGTLFVGGNNASTSFAGTISGSGGMTKDGTGTFTLTGANTYTGPTLVSAGTLAVSSTGRIAGTVRNRASFTNAGTVAGMVQNDAMLTSTGNLAGGLNNFGTASLAGQVGGVLSNNGTVTFTGNATIAALQQGAGGSLNLVGSTVAIGDIGGSGAINLGSGALSLGSNNFSSTYGGTIAGSGSLTKTGNRTLVLTGAATHSGGTTISGGVLQIGNGGTTGSLSGAIVNNAWLVLDRSDAVTLSNVMSGTGTFQHQGTGTTTLTGANTYSGGTIVAAGRLRGDTASLQGEIEIDGALEFAQTGAGTYAGSLYGAGLFDKTGIGVLNLTGNNAAFYGATHLIGGGLAVNGLLSHSIITVSSGATLSGTGTAGGVILQSGATIAPGNSVGTFNVAGNILFQAGSLFAAEVQGNTADRIQATGTAQLNGTLQVIALGGNYGINSTFVLLHADGGVSGTFATTNLGGFGLAYRPKIIYTANEVQLLLAPNQLSAVLGTGVPLTYNQASSIGRLDAAVMTGGYDPTALSALYSLAPAAIPAALDQLSGEIYADATRAALEDERVVREAALGRLGEAADAGLTGTGGWGQLIGSRGSVDSDGNGAGYDVDRTGMLMGIDSGAETDTGSWRAGVMGHYTRITVPADARGSRATIDRTGGGFYAGVAVNGWRVRAGASLSLLDLKARRAIVVPGLTTSERGKARGVMLQTFGEISFRIDAGKQAFVEPYLAGSATRVTFGQFAESSGPVALLVRDQKSVLGIGELGLRGETALVGGDRGSVRLGGNIGLRTAFGDRAPDPAIALAAAPNLAFNIRSAEIDRFSAVANLNLIVDVSDKLSLRLGYSGVQGAGVREHGGRATLSLRF